MARIPMDGSIDAITPANKPRLLYAGDTWLGDSQPYLAVQDDGIRIVGDLDNGISIDGEFGTLIKGPVSLAAQPADIRIAGYWAINPMVLTCIGSSAAMNIPMLVPAAPALLDAAKDMAGILNGV